jgi:hypothetical protein
MASATAQARANALNAKLEGEAQVAIDQIDKQFIRPIARQSYACALKCYDKAGSSGDSQQLELCARKCQMPHQQAGQYVQQVSFTLDFIYFLSAFSTHPSLHVFCFVLQPH